MIAPRTSGVAEAVTLADCLAGTALAAAPDPRALLAGNGPVIPAAALAATLTDWQAKFAQILDIPIGRIVKAAGLKLAIDVPTAEVEPETGEMFVPLLPFAVESSHHPTIVVTCAAIVVTLRFDLEISLEVSGAQLRLADDRFTGMHTGKTKGIVHISCLNHSPALEIGSPEFTLPGRLDFAKPAARQRHS